MGRAGTGELGWLIDRLGELVALPTVSADSATSPAMRRCAARLAEVTREIGFPEVRVDQAGGAPCVLANWTVARRGPRVLLYGHYDVQPATEPGWSSDPFLLRRQGGHVVGRGTSDDKGQLLAALSGIARSVGRGGRPPVNLCCLFEGEEEIGSPTISALLRRHRRRLISDGLLVCDTEQRRNGDPTLTVSCRGEATFDVEVRGTRRAVHAGRFGGGVHDPAQALVEALSGLHDQHGRIVVPDFYSAVRPRRPLATVVRQAELAAVGARPWGDPAFSLGERLTTRPAVVITSLTSGHQGRGPHHSIPASARAQLNVRIVPDQDPRRVAELVVRHLRSRVGALDLRAELLLDARPFVADRPGAVRAAAELACCEVVGRRPVAVRSGGTIPALAHLVELAPDAVLLGFGHPDDRAHGPDENIAVARLDQLADTVAALLRRLGSGGRP